MTKEERLQKLYEIRDSGIFSVSIDGQTITYRSLADLNNAIALLEKNLHGRKRRGVPVFLKDGRLDPRLEGERRV